MEQLKYLEKRWLELIRKSFKSKEELDEMERVGNNLEILYKKEVLDLMRDLREVGFKVNDVWDLVNTKDSYPVAIPVLINHLSKPYHIKNKEGIVRALAVKEAKGIACKGIIEEYKKATQDDYRWILGNTMEVIITKDCVDDVINIVQNQKQNGMSRQMFVLALGKVKSEKVEHALLDLLNDEEVLPHALDALGKHKSIKAKHKISTLVNHKNALIRKEAVKALKKIEK